MRRVAVFGNAGGGKSTLARQLAQLTQLPLYSIDMIQYRPDGEEVPHAEYLKAHKPQWRMRFPRRQPSEGRTSSMIVTTV
jgi:adenylate kinase family enzyme